MYDNTTAFPSPVFSVNSQIGFSASDSWKPIVEWTNRYLNVSLPVVQLPRDPVAMSRSSARVNVDRSSSLQQDDDLRRQHRVPALETERTGHRLDSDLAHTARPVRHRPLA
jgi:hypothetical protein